MSDPTEPSTEDVPAWNDAPSADAPDFLTPEELPDTARTFIPNEEHGGTTVFAKETTVGDNAGFFVFFTGQPVYLPTEIAEGLANFILNK